MDQTRADTLQLYRLQKEQYNYLIYSKKLMNYKTKKKLIELRNYVDGDANTLYEYIMLFIIVINTVSLGLETSQKISPNFRNILFIIDQICLWVFIFELIFKFIVFNKAFFGEYRISEDNGIEYFHWNKWNISDLIIVLVSIISTLPYFTVFRVFRVFRSVKVIRTVKSLKAIKSFKLVNDVTNLRTTFKGLVKAIPGILWTFCFLALFAYVYAIIGTNIFRDEFPEFFGTLGLSCLSLCQILTFDSWVSQIARPIIQLYPASWIYFISYGFIAASVIMNVIVGIIVDSMTKVREQEQEKRNQTERKKQATIELLSQQINELQREIEILNKKL